MVLANYFVSIWFNYYQFQVGQIEQAIIIMIYLFKFGSDSSCVFLDDKVLLSKMLRDKRDR